jgi:hypothetical protein
MVAGAETTENVVISLPSAVDGEAPPTAAGLQPAKRTSTTTRAATIGTMVMSAKTRSFFPYDVFIYGSFPILGHY